MFTEPREFPDMKGFLTVNLKRMRLFSKTYPTFEIESQAVTQLPWGHILTLLFQIKDDSQREW